MILVNHRCNQIVQLQSTPVQFGVEIDIRNHGDSLIVTHDPFVMDGPRLEDWLGFYRHSFLIANVKEEGLEPRLTTLLHRHGVKDFFVLDESFPFIRKYALAGLSNFALRISEFEDHRTALNLAAYLRQHGRSVEWIWVDSFEGEVLDPSIAAELKLAEFKLCFVSPELHHLEDRAVWEPLILKFKEKLGRPGMEASQPDMVCSKLLALWDK